MQAEKKILKGDLILQNLESIVNRNYLHFEIKGLTRPTRDILNEVIQGILNRLEANPLASFHLFSGIMEALLNGVKGNLRHVIFKDELLNKLTHSDEESSMKEAEEMLEIILDTSPLRDAMQRYVVPDKLKKTVQKILQLQDKIRSKKTNFSDHEKEYLAEARNKIQKEDFKISMKIRISDDDIYFRIRNDAPIMGLDMKRIDSSREQHAELAKAGRSSEFFRPDYLDEKESAGFGIAMIDEGFYSMGIDPLTHFTIVSSNKITTVYMRYPIADLQKMDF
ncbi:hypothetical protein [Leptospira sp. GIMC2001]|uniref:hypothetical protein n=1 Tax=Leptospira sp. GIMC2001 TaxID=1513297 RepID=UPI00234B5230|nr:hypothetical protein [Leptospira sp. GIMC2001]WCL50602.1 hypothetical protein O4O04_07235 [Leptospira sp. GIMC2001]